jgi:prephenate dehydrogenase
VKLAIVGAGLIGTSIALASRRVDPETHVVALDRGDSLEAAQRADLIVLAAPVDAILSLLRDHAALFRHALVTDVGSTKRLIVEAAAAAGLTRFVGGHPMAGAASSGPTAARADLFEQKPWFLVPHHAPAEALEAVRTFVEQLGARPVEFDDDGSKHDRVMAAVSHLPQVVASMLMKVVGDAVGDEGLQWAGAGCRDTTRLAGSTASVWQSILATNREALTPLLLTLAEELQRYGAALETADATARLMDAANEYRRLLERTR